VNSLGPIPNLYDGCREWALVFILCALVVVGAVIVGLVNR